MEPSLSPPLSPAQVERSRPGSFPNHGFTYPDIVEGGSEMTALPDHGSRWTADHHATIGPRAGASIIRSHPGLQAGGPEAGYVRPAPHDRDVREDARTYAARAAGVVSPQPSYPLPGQGAEPPSLATFGLSEHDTGYDVNDDYDEVEYEPRPTPAQAYAQQTKRRSISSQPGQLSVRQVSDPELGSPFRPRSSSNPVPTEQARAVSAPMQKDVSRPPVAASVTRQRRPSNNSSTGSTSGLTKDDLIERLAEAVRLEQANVLHFRSEVHEAEAENDRLTRVNAAQLAAHRASQQQLMSRIVLLEHDLKKARDELAHAQQIDESRVDHYLGLIAGDSLPAPTDRLRQTSGPTIGAFDVAALRATGAVRPDVGESVFTETSLSGLDREVVEASNDGTLGERARRRKEERERRTAAALSTIDSSQAYPRDTSAFDGSSETDSPQPIGTGPRKLSRSNSVRKGFSGFSLLRRNSGSRNDQPPPLKIKSSANTSSTSLAVPAQVRLTGDEGGTYGRSASSDVPRPPVSGAMARPPVSGAVNGNLKPRPRKNSLSDIVMSGVKAAFPSLRDRSDDPRGYVADQRPVPQPQAHDVPAF